ncbi:nuclear transport factor 2 family protein [Gammaproteobacteria bacterium]|nr:nuclear transport factor 2 family protein [Gammaproteobacteria bacterium]
MRHLLNPSINRLIKRVAQIFINTLLSLTVTIITLASANLHADTVSDLQELRESMTTLSNRIDHLRDISAIEKLQRSYGYYVDKQQWYDVADLFTEDGTLEIGGRGVFLGRDRVFEYLRTGLGPIGPTTGIMHDHQQFQGIVTVSPDGMTAEGRWTAFVMGGAVWGDVTYENDYVKENGVWKISKLRAPFNMYSSVDIGWIDRTTPNTRPESFLPPPDLPPSVLYLTFPNYYNEPFHYPNPVTGQIAPPSDPTAGGMRFGK